MLSSYTKEMTPCRVKAKERQDVDIDKLVKFGAAAVNPPRPVYADLTDLPQTRGEAVSRIMNLTSGVKPEFVSALLQLGPEQAFEHLKQMEASVPREKTSAKTRVPAATSPSKKAFVPPGAPEVGPEGDDTRSEDHPK